MTEATLSTMHRDHTLWASEVSIWRDDLRDWQQELGKAQAELVQLEKPLQDHAHTLRVHGSALRLYEQEFLGHEHTLADIAKGGGSNSLSQLEPQHRQEADHQAQQREAHEQLKRHHHIVMMHWRSLLQALRQPLQGHEVPANR